MDRPYSAGTVASRIAAHLARHLDAIDERARAAEAPAPDVPAIEAMLDAAFWASLRREEGYEPHISLAFVPPDAADYPLIFERPLALDPSTLARVAPAVERPGIHLGVWRLAGELCVWGTTRTIPALSFVLEVASPGLLVVKHHRGASGKFVNVAVIEGDRVKIVDERASSLPDCPDLLASLLGFDSPTTWMDSVNVLVRIAISMRAHRRGGLLLIVPPGSEAWRESILRPIPYAVAPPFSELGFLWRLPVEERSSPLWRDSLDKAVDVVAGLTAVDGATLMTADYELLAFGAKIARRRGWPPIEQVTVTEPIEGGVAVVVDPAQLGGTRHLSAAQFVLDQRDAIALVASQDGRFTIFAWSPCEEMVHAHRVETLLL